MEYILSYVVYSFGSVLDYITLSGISVCGDTQCAVHDCKINIIVSDVNNYKFQAKQCHVLIGQFNIILC